MTSFGPKIGLHGVSISKEHEESADRVAEILESSGFLVDREVNVEVDAEVKERFNLDVCAIHKDGMVIVEAKTERNVEFKEEILGWSKKQEKLADFTKVRVLASRRSKIGSIDIRRVRSHAVVFFSTKDNPKREHLRQASAARISFWDTDVLRYYGETARTLGLWTKYEIMHDLHLWSGNAGPPGWRTELEC